MKKNPILEHNYLKACISNDLKEVRFFLHHEYFKNAPQKYQQSILNEGLASSTHCGLDVIKYLLTSPDLPLHADIHENANRPLRLAIKRGTFEQVEYLLTSPAFKEDVAVNGNESVFLTACYEGSLESVRFLLTSQKLKNKANIKELDKYDRDALFHAIGGMNLPVVKFLLTSNELKEKSDISLCAKEGLFFAASKGGLEIIDYLCFSSDLKTHVNIEEIKEKLALNCVEFSKLNILKWLMNLDSPPKFNSKNYLKSTIFEVACGRENLDILNFLLYDCKYNVTSKEKLKVKNYRCQDSSGYIGMIERRDLFFKLNSEIKDIVKNKVKNNQNKI